jgi:6-phosphofructokinase 1
MNKAKKITSIGILCSGGDSPGMNCAIRSVVRTAIGEGLKAYGIQRGYQGLIEGQIRELKVASVGNILHTGGTILQTSRSKEFLTPEGRAKAAKNLRDNKIDALVVIGGNGSYKGAKALSDEQQIPVLGIPGTIDNDISGTDYSIGFDTAVQTGIEAVDKIRDTASSHERTFLVEVMGRNSPAIAVHVAVCSGAENIIFPKRKVDLERVVADIRRGIARGKNSSIIIVAEGDKPGMSYDIQKELKEKFSLEAHVCILGHTQRGGHPTHLDRFISSRMGFEAVKALLAGNTAGATAFVQGKVEIIPLDQSLADKLDYEAPYLELVRTLSI